MATAITARAFSRRPGLTYRQTADGAVRVYRHGGYLGEIGQFNGRYYWFRFGGVRRFAGSPEAAMEALVGAKAGAKCPPDQ